MHHDEVLLALAYRVKSRFGDHSAVLAELDPKGPKIKSVGLQGAVSHETPIVNVLQGRDPGGPPGKRPLAIATTKKPTEMCVGMAWKYPVRYIVHVEGATVRKITITDDGNSFAGANHPLSGGPLLLSANNDAKMPRHAWGNDAWVDGWFSWLERQGQRTTAGERALAVKKPPNGPHRSRVEPPEVLDTGIPVAGPSRSGARQEFRDRLFMHLAYALVREGWATDTDDSGRGGGEGGLKGGYNIGSILVDPTGRILAWGLNLIGTNKSFHAETVMLQSYLERHEAEKLPAGCTMYTTLESCHMCAGFAAEVGNGLKVVYGQKDELITNNALERKVKGSAQAPTSAAFLATKQSPIAKGTSPAIEYIEALFKKYRLDTRKRGATGFLYHTLGEYFYEEERRRPGGMKAALETIQRAPELPTAPPRLGAPALPTTPPVGGGSTTDPSVMARLGVDLPGRPPTAPPPRQHTAFDRLDLALPTGPVDPEARRRKTESLMGREMALAEHSVQFAAELIRAGMLK